MLAVMALMETGTRRVGRRGGQTVDSHRAAPSGTGGGTRSSTGRPRSSPSAGYHATSTTELCEANQLGKGALYYYIGSKEELLAAIHDRVMDEVLLGADRVAAAGGTPTEQLAMLGTELLDVIARYPDHVWVFLHEFPALTGDNATQFRAPAARVRTPRRSGARGRHRVG